MSDFDNDFQIDWERERRTGIPEAVLCAFKSAAQIEAILKAAGEADRRLLFTRLEPSVFASLGEESRAALANYDPVSRTAWCGGTPAEPSIRPGIGIVAAGTSDLPVATEAARTLEFLGFQSPVIADVGVAGLWRLMRRLDDIRSYRVVIAVAGMEGALFSVLAGLTDAPVIAVPASVGYGVSAGGMAALHSALASCAPGILTVNIDNGFGAAVAAVKMINKM
ncbi:1-(5-phosphoribosyl)-5-amino-4-imidazole-carboxyl ate carboxylase [Skermanella aerolata]|uniref:1-(5-phosphoribosyl)-5-amino-4-imidazole-carboxyl ate carboxylase n=1 Tax=Skermanella aerolata TaxID=393310 RepID=A0A512DRB5_9PROT|nr:nickel pincer cofactor biosynthesis protein LarB [Skermanella aerolata]KJB92534.1 circadian phase modifier CpmA [Skermanella aerolata KACC 11604]GEO39032.1 1-(5-phosphoribosyl)-5-amino-4-imidazole-carboxyl ate carboxylase [Skermanella aerolata]